MDRSIKIAENLTVGDWLDLKERLEEDMQNNALWEDAISFFDKRLSSRYLKPIKAIENNSSIDGEGFSIMAILCSMIEALESFYQGRTYRKASKEQPLDEKAEYYKSQPLFESFLTNREPFNSKFSENNLAKEFYENVRCAILHEAATRNGWIVRIDTDKLIVKQGGKIVINRALFVQEIEAYIKRYKEELMQNTDLKHAYIRKFNSICDTA
jgi:hypothetical protein